MLSLQLHLWIAHKGIHRELSQVILRALLVVPTRPEAVVISRVQRQHNAGNGLTSAEYKDQRPPEIIVLPEEGLLSLGAYASKGLMEQRRATTSRNFPIHKAFGY
jgi:hypothetical protein